MFALSLVTASGLSLFLGFVLHLFYQRRAGKAKVDSAEVLAVKIVANAEREAETKKKEALLEAKDLLFKERAEFEESSNLRRQELLTLERRLTAKEEGLEKRLEGADRRESELEVRDQGLGRRDAELSAKEAEVSRLVAEERAKLEAVAGLTAEAARKLVVESVERTARAEAAGLAKRLEDEARESADRKAKKIIGTAIQRWAAP